jgi:hypothetical protein
LSPANDANNNCKLMSGISIDFDSRDRVKVMGRLLTIELLEDTNKTYHSMLDLFKMLDCSHSTLVDRS